MRASAASVKLTDDNMSELDSTQPVFAGRPCEGGLHAKALIIENSSQRVCFVSCDALTIPSRVAESATGKIAAATGIPETHIIICATHAHGGPCTVENAGWRPDKEYLRRLEVGSIRACVKAAVALEHNEDDGTELFLGLGQEATIGRNSRPLLRDGNIGWRGYRKEDMVRPTGPYDPDIHALVLRRAQGKYAGLIFNHSVHNNVAVGARVLSPCMYGLAALELEQQHGAPVLFVPGAFGSTHNRTHLDSGLSGAECVNRIVAAVNETLDCTRPIPDTPWRILRRAFKYRVRTFDEERESAAVKCYLERYTPNDAEHLQAFHRAMRDELAPCQGAEREAVLQVMRLGDVGLVAIPGEMFASLGLELRRCSPLRHTMIVGLANGTINYIPDRKAYDYGGYQTWTGMTVGAAGTGEAMVEQALVMLNELMRDA